MFSAGAKLNDVRGQNHHYFHVSFKTCFLFSMLKYPARVESLMTILSMDVFFGWSCSFLYTPEN